jgi:transposase
LRRVRRKLLSSDPQRRAILRRLKGLWRHRRRGELLAFFDVQPITVKAYGGRRYTHEKQLILAAKQKTRGRFYLFLLYVVNHGRVRWAYFAGKGADCVCRFMRLLRRWYPTQRLRIALDQDPAHPRKAKRTKRLMRRLGLRWTSLPKGSPDDNPVETIFSDVQQAILDNSDDPNAKATQRRISAHLRSRNRRKDRFMRISYLGIVPKNR